MQNEYQNDGKILYFLNIEITISKDSLRMQFITFYSKITTAD